MRSSIDCLADDGVDADMVQYRQLHGRHQREYGRVRSTDEPSDCTISTETRARSKQTRGKMKILIRNEKPSTVLSTWPWRPGAAVRHVACEAWRSGGSSTQERRIEHAGVEDLARQGGGSGTPGRGIPHAGPDVWRGSRARGRQKFCVELFWPQMLGPFLHF